MDITNELLRSIYTEMRLQSELLGQILLFNKNIEYHLADPTRPITPIMSEMNAGDIIAEMIKRRAELLADIKIVPQTQG